MSLRSPRAAAKSAFGKEIVCRIAFGVTGILCRFMEDQNAAEVQSRLNWLTKFQEIRSECLFITPRVPINFQTGLVCLRLSRSSPQMERKLTLWQAHKRGVKLHDF